MSLIPHKQSSVLIIPTGTLIHNKRVEAILVSVSCIKNATSLNWLPNHRDVAVYSFSREGFAIRVREVSRQRERLPDGGVGDRRVDRNVGRLERADGYLYRGCYANICAVAPKDDFIIIL